ncbi:PQQ-dependent sugar dehydrogenase [Clostridium zeae]|nr:PQQ-dependent sugar dehydrogenase [Clostridium zeae]
MKKIIVVTFTIILSLIGAAILFNNVMKYDITCLDREIGVSIKFKGIKDANCFTYDCLNNIYLGTDNGIELIKTDGKNEDIIKDKDLKISSIIYKDEKLYYISDNKLIGYDLKSKKKDILISNLPRNNDIGKYSIIARDNSIFISISAATNSGVVNEKNSIPDTSPIELTLKGINYGQEATGSFSGYGVKTKNGQVIKVNSIGNACVISYDIKNKKSQLFSSGIRNVEGWDYNSSGALMAVVGGFENNGSRAVQGDTDYIYELKKDIWYGWPDYSGGDPLNSPKFTDENGKSVKMLLSKLPMLNPPAPFYVHSDAGSIYGLVVDREGAIKEKDSMFFYDKNETTLYNLDDNGLNKKILKFNDNIELKDIKLVKQSIYILDKKNGIMYEMKKEEKNLVGGYSNIMFFSLCVIISVMVLILMKIKKS